MNSHGKAIISVIALLYGAPYCFAVFHCWKQSVGIDSEISDIWRETTFGRIIAIALSTGIFLLALYAPTLVGDASN